MNIIYCTFCWTEHAHQVDLLVYLGDPGELNVQLGHMSPCQKTAQHSTVRLPIISTIKSSSFSPRPKGGSPVCDCVCALFTRATEEKFTDKAILTYVSATPTECLTKDLPLEAAFSPRCRKSCVTLITMCKSWFCAGLRWITVISHAFVVEHPLNQVLHDLFLVKRHFISATHWIKRSSTRQGVSEIWSFLLLLFQNLISFCRQLPEQEHVLVERPGKAVLH